jgi:FAD/FMN-containing dehydrogenase
MTAVEPPMAANLVASARLSRRALLQCFAASAFACAHAPRTKSTFCNLVIERRVLTAFDNIHHEEPFVVWPHSCDELAGFLRSLSDLPIGRRVTFRSGGKSIDEQALNDDIVVMLTDPCFKRVGEVTLEPDGVAVITTGASATWETILARTTEVGFVALAMPSAKDITAGGGLSSHSISRFSPVWLKEGNHVRRLTVMLLDGTTPVLRRDAPAGSDERELFLGVVAGFGFLGAILDVTYELLRVAPPGAQVQVATRTSIVDVRGRWSDLLGLLQRRAEEQRAALPPVKNLSPWRPGGALAGTAFPEPTPTIYASVWWSAAGMQQRAMLAESRYVYDRDLAPMILYEPDNELMGVIEDLMSANPWADRAIQDVATDLFSSGAVAVTPVAGFTFFQDANAFVRERELGHPRIVVLQQTFVLRDVNCAAGFLTALTAFVRGPHEQPTVGDLMWIPPDEHHFRLSSHALCGGFALTLTYLRPGASAVARLRQDLQEISNLCRAHHGTIHLVKSVEVAAQADLEATFHAQFDVFRALKHRYDPQGRLVNNFYRRVLGPFGTWPPGPAIGDNCPAFLAGAPCPAEP